MWVVNYRDEAGLVKYASARFLVASPEYPELPHPQKSAPTEENVRTGSSVGAGARVAGPARVSVWGVRPTRLLQDREHRPRPR